jgi:hypothetical protein
VDPKTGTVYVRGEVANARPSLLPGMFVRVRVPVAVRKNAVLIPEKAIRPTWAANTSLRLIGRKQYFSDAMWRWGRRSANCELLRKGLDGSETFIVGGLTMARPGMPITPVPEEGVQTNESEQKKTTESKN